jgi:cell division protein FtsL
MKKLMTNTVLAWLSVHIGLVYKYQQKYDEGLKNYLVRVKIQEAGGDKEGVSISYNNIGMLYIEKKALLAKAKGWIQKGLALAKEMGVKPPIRDSYLALARVTARWATYTMRTKVTRCTIVIPRQHTDNENTEKVVQQKMQYELTRKIAWLKRNRR